jgi:hypothetical protein
MVEKVENFENQFHNMVNISIDSIDKDCCGFVITSPLIGCGYVFNIANIFFPMINALPCSLLAKQHDFWNTKIRYCMGILCTNCNSRAKSNSTMIK